MIEIAKQAARRAGDFVKERFPLDGCLLARGWIDYVVMQRSGVMDVAAGILIAQKARAAVTNGDGTPYRHLSFSTDQMPSILGANSPLHDSIRALIRE